MTTLTRPWAQRLRWWPGRRRRDPEATMSVLDHLLELRRRLAWALVALAVGTVAGFVWYEHGVLGVPSLGALLIEPYCSLPPSARAGLNGTDCRLLATGPFDQFLLRVKVAATAGVVLSAPGWLGQLWAFVTPGLRRHERRGAVVFTGTASLLFAGGAVVAYLVVAQALRFLLGIGNSVQTTALRGDEYYSLVLSLMVVFGVGFLTPLVVVMLNRVGVVSYRRLASWRRGMIFGAFLFAGIATPGGDPISMAVLGLALCVLLELAVQVCRLHDRRRARRDLGWADLADDEASPRPDASPLADGR
ncbi:twin-arginine translocase subunit TatC [Actinomycetospora straminea]|uniref:Sec-independent protein translocase protein TatC n=1 Tax=Actinomycetospora straminea TaxID=663607 RepID=A0ABP9EDJ2_9PSEU|nr:twin-arginine translocase subunit TatC [Actinomycetospora straminea]MDD7934535.1 twin-arginine translocase subunit TatC [Actinomycetospora straminea]